MFTVVLIVFRKPGEFPTYIIFMLYKYNVASSDTSPDRSDACPMKKRLVLSDVKIFYVIRRVPHGLWINSVNERLVLLLSFPRRPCSTIDLNRPRCSICGKSDFSYGGNFESTYLSFLRFPYENYYLAPRHCRIIKTTLKPSLVGEMRAMRIDRVVAHLHCRLTDTDTRIGRIVMELLNERNRLRVALHKWAITENVSSNVKRTRTYIIVYVHRRRYECEKICLQK